MSELGSLYIPELKVYDSGMHSVSCWFWDMQHVLWFQFVTNIHSSKFPRFLLIIFTCFQWTVGFYCYPKTEHFLLNCFLLPQIICQCVLKCVLLNLVRTNLLLYCLQCSWCGLQLFSFLMSAQASSLKWEQCLCFFVYFYTSSWEQNTDLYLVCMPALLFILRFGAVVVTGGGMFTSVRHLPKDGWA